MDWLKAMHELKSARETVAKKKAEAKLDDAFNRLVESSGCHDPGWDADDGRALDFHRKLDALQGTRGLRILGNYEQIAPADPEQ